MKEGMRVVDHLNTFNTLIVQLTSMEVKLEDEDKAITLLCLFPESWDSLVTSISFSSTDVLDYDSVVGALLAEEMRRKSSQETSTSEAMVIRGRPKEKRRIREVLHDLSQEAERVEKNVGTVEKQGISRKIVGKEKNLRRTLQRKKIWLQQIQV
jgi:hypothetical protein